jgi:hypothetical protein
MNPIDSTQASKSDSRDAALDGDYQWPIIPDLSAVLVVAVDFQWVVSSVLLSSHVISVASPGKISDASATRGCTQENIFKPKLSHIGLKRLSQVVHLGTSR